jgi:uncharacterized repeat protein (TIGR03803 family)
MKPRRLTCISALIWFAAVSPQLVAQSPETRFHVLYRFPGGSGGSMPAAGLIRDTAGSLYGTTYYGGDLSCNWYLLPGCGVLFKLDKAGNETVLHSFKGGPSDGRNPNSTLVRDSAGNLYGTTFSGGAFNNSGTIFKLDTKGNETVLHGFTGGADGDGPVSGLTLGADGALYGVTSFGGNTSCSYGYSGIPGCGVVFKLDTNGQFMVLHTFAAESDGAGPVTAPLFDSAGNLYGTTAFGGDGFCQCGLVFKLDNTGNETVLYRFKGWPDGGGPVGNLIQDAAGTIYGPTVGGGHHLTCNCGTVFQLESTNQETVLHSFTVNDSAPIALMQNSSQNFYGTSAAFQFDPGIVFSLGTNGTYNVIYRFTGGSDGLFPISLMQYDPATFVGVTESGGDSAGDGVVFEIKP